MSLLFCAVFWPASVSSSYLRKRPCDRSSKEIAEQTAQQIGDMNRRTLVCRLDLADVAQIQPMVAHVVSELGRIDILVNVNAVSPSVVPTLMWKKNVQEKSRISGTDAEKESKEFIERIPLKRAGSPEDMAGAVAFLCSPDSDYITGQTLNVDGGFEMN